MLSSLWWRLGLKASEAWYRLRLGFADDKRKTELAYGRCKEHMAALGIPCDLSQEELVEGLYAVGRALSGKMD